MMDLTPLVRILASLLAALVTAMLVPRLRDALEARCNAETLRALGAAARAFVRAAEQIYDAGEAERKKQYVQEYLEKFLEERGMRVDLSAVNAAIEAAVHDMNAELRRAPRGSAEGSHEHA